MADLSHIFPTGIVESVDKLPSVRADKQLIIAISQAGLSAPDEIVMDGELHRFSTNGKRGDKSGWYVVFDGQIPSGAFGCWRQGIESTWRSDIGRELTQIEQMQHAQRMRDAKIARDKADAERKANAAINASQIWEIASIASDEHPYLQKKKISNPGFKVGTDGRLIAPLFIDNEIVGLQYIDSDGKKMFMTGSKSGGAYWWLSGSNETIYITEGIATAASVHQATGNTVIISFSANNLSSVSSTIRKVYGNLTKLVIVADNDESGVGFREAAKAAEIAKTQVIQIPVLGDANDYVNEGHDLLALLKPPIVEHGYLIDADDFASAQMPIRWLIKNWLQRDALMMIHGPSGGGKTFAVLDLCLTVATGKPEWGGNKCKPGSIVYLAGEGHHGLRGRIAAWKRSNGVNSFNGQFHISKAGTDLNTPEGYLMVRDAINALPQHPDVIAVDTLHRFLMGDENSAQDAKTMLDACAGLMRDFDCSVILVHHTGVSDEAQHRARGSSAWRGALDIEISVVPGKDGGPMQLIQRKSKDAELAKPVWMQIEGVALDWIDEDGEQVKSAVARIVDHHEMPTTTKEPKPLSDARQCFESALIEFGRIDHDDELYITDEAWSEWMRKSGKWDSDGSRRTAKNRFKNILINNKLIINKSDGFIILNEDEFIGIRLIIG